MHALLSRNVNGTTCAVYIWDVALVTPSMLTIKTKKNTHLALAYNVLKIWAHFFASKQNKLIKLNDVFGIKMRSRSNNSYTFRIKEVKVKISELLLMLFVGLVKQCHLEEVLTFNLPNSTSHISLTKVYSVTWRVRLTHLQDAINAFTHMRCIRGLDYTDLSNSLLTRTYIYT